MDIKLPNYEFDDWKVQFIKNDANQVWPENCSGSIGFSIDQHSNNTIHTIVRTFQKIAGTQNPEFTTLKNSDFMHVFIILGVNQTDSNDVSEASTIEVAEMTGSGIDRSNIKLGEFSKRDDHFVIFTPKNPILKRNIRQLAILSSAANLAHRQLKIGDHSKYDILGAVKGLYKKKLISKNDLENKNIEARYTKNIEQNFYSLVEILDTDMITRKNKPQNFICSAFATKILQTAYVLSEMETRHPGDLKKILKNVEISKTNMINYLNNNPEVVNNLSTKKIMHLKATYAQPQDLFNNLINNV